MRIVVESLRGRTSPLGRGDAYVGRTNARYGMKGSSLANPFAVKREADREPAIVRYRAWLTAKLASRDAAVTAELERLGRLAEAEPQLRLFCWCSPRACHADVIADILRMRPARRDPTP